MRKHKAGHPVSEGGGKDAFQVSKVGRCGRGEIRDAVESVLTGTLVGMAEPCYKAG